MTRVRINSEIGALETIIVHRPGPEVELMGPEEAAEALYDDIIYLNGAAREHDQMVAALRQFATVYTLETLLVETLEIDAARETILDGMCSFYGAPPRLRGELGTMESGELARQLIVGTPMPRHTLGSFLHPMPYALPPLYNLYFMRDAAMCINERMVIGAMVNRARWGEALILRAIVDHHPAISAAGYYLDGTRVDTPGVSIEGGDVQVLREDLVLIGMGERTSQTGIDLLLQGFDQVGKIRHVVVQPMPRARAYIHLDLVFTMIDRELCVIHEPVILGPDAIPPIHIELRGDQPPRIRRGDNLLALLRELDLPLDHVVTGGCSPLQQAREQWHKGTNFFALAPGKIIGYARNEYTCRELEQRGFASVAGQDVLDGRVDLGSYDRVVVAMEGAELSRGGGGCRCMTLPIRRADLGG